MVEKVLGVLAGQEMPVSMLLKWARSADVVLAADGGANRLVSVGCEPLVIVGDLDSASKSALASGAQVRRDESQDSTDCDKMLAHAKDAGHTALTLVSIEGDLPDHELATLNSALRSVLMIRIAFRRGIGWILRAGNEVRAKTVAGRRVSLIPLVPSTASLYGVEWALDRAGLEPDGLISISNRASDTRVVASLETGGALLFVEYPEEEMPVW